MYSAVIKFLLFAIACIVITEKGLCRVEWKRQLSNGSEFDSTTSKYQYTHVMIELALSQVLLRGTVLEFDIWSA